MFNNDLNDRTVFQNVLLTGSVEKDLTSSVNETINIVIDEDCYLRITCGNGNNSQCVMSTVTVYINNLNIINLTGAPIVNGGYAFVSFITPKFKKGSQIRIIGNARFSFGTAKLTMTPIK